VVTNVTEEDTCVEIQTDSHNVKARFDGIFDTDSTQEDVYDKVRFASESVVSGFNSTVSFSFGFSQLF